MHPNLALAATVFLFMGARAAYSQPTPTPDSSAYLRTWVMLPAEVRPKIVGDAPSLAQDLNLIFDDGTGKPETLARHLRPFHAGGYAEFIPATRKLRLVAGKGDAVAELASVKIDMKPSSFHTVIVEKVAGHYRLGLIDDTPKPIKPSGIPGEPPPPPPKQIFFYNFLPGDATTISSKQAGFQKTLIYGAPPEVARDLPAKLFTIEMPLRSEGRTYVGEVEIDLRTSDSLSFLIVQDLYGRTIAMVVPNGKLD